VPGVNLTRAEAKARSGLIAVQSYEIDLNLVTGDETFISTTIVNFTCNSPGSSTFIDAVGKSIISATLNGAPVDVTAFDGESVHLQSLASSNQLIIAVEGVYSKSGEGLHRFVDPADNEVYLYSQHEVADARRTFACFDQPDLKATFAISATVPAHWAVISNNPVESADQTGANKKWIFTPTPRISTYLTALVAGAYHRVDDFMLAKKLSHLLCIAAHHWLKAWTQRIFSKSPNRVSLFMKKNSAWHTHLISTIKSRLPNSMQGQWKMLVA